MVGRTKETGIILGMSKMTRKKNKAFIFLICISFRLSYLCHSHENTDSKGMFMAFLLYSKESCFLRVSMQQKRGNKTVTPTLLEIFAKRCSSSIDGINDWSKSLSSTSKMSEWRYSNKIKLTYCLFSIHSTVTAMLNVC